MLQIASGKLFGRDAAQRNELRGVLYTNLQLYGRPAIETVAGRLLSTDSMSPLGAVVYEITELIEDEPQAGAVVSHGVDPYLSDFGTVVSFALNVICTPDQEAFRRMMSGLGGALGNARPRNLVSKVFDEQIWCGDEQAEELVQFTEITELIEDEPQAGAVVSHGVDPYLSDFGTVVCCLRISLLSTSFALLIRRPSGG